MASRVAIDLGTANTRVIVHGKDKLIQQPSLVAVEKSRRRVVSYGDQAWELLGKEPLDLQVVSPIRSGKVANYQLSFKLVQELLAQALGVSRWSRPEIIIGAPYDLSSVENRALVRLLDEIGVRDKKLLPIPVAAAVGAGLPLMDATASTVIDIGAGTVEMGLISVGGVVAAGSTTKAGKYLNSQVTSYIRQKHKMNVGYKTVEQLLREFKFGRDYDQQHQINGSRLGDGAPASAQIRLSELQSQVELLLAEIVTTFTTTIDGAPPELVSDIAERGIALTGMLSNLDGIEEYLSKALRVPVYKVEQPETSVVRGLMESMYQPQILKRNAR